MDYRNIPLTIPKFQSSKTSVGLELVDIYLWLFKRFLDHKLSNPLLLSFIKSQLYKVYYDEVSIKATSERFAVLMRDLPEVTYEQELRAKQMQQQEEMKRKKYVEEYYKSLAVNEES